MAPRPRLQSAREGANDSSGKHFVGLQDWPAGTLPGLDAVGYGRADPGPTYVAPTSYQLTGRRPRPPAHGLAGKLALHRLLESYGGNIALLLVPLAFAVVVLARRDVLVDDDVVQTWQPTGRARTRAVVEASVLALGRDFNIWAHAHACCGSHSHTATHTGLRCISENRVIRPTTHTTAQPTSANLGNI